MHTQNYHRNGRLICQQFFDRAEHPRKIIGVNYPDPADETIKPTNKEEKITMRTNHKEEPMEMPQMIWNNYEADDPVRKVVDHLEKKYGRAGAEKKMVAMTGRDFVLLHDQIKRGQPQQHQGTGEAPMTMPEMQW